MKRFFARLLERLIPLVRLNLVFVLTALPLVTAPAALYALVRTLVRLLPEDADFPPVKTYWKYFRTDFWNAWRCGAAWLLPAVLLALFMRYYRADAGENALHGALYALDVAALALWSMLGALYLPMVTSVALPWKRQVKNAFLLTMAYPLPALKAAAAAGVPLFLLLRLALYTAPLLLFVAFSIPLYCALQCVWGMIETHVLPREGA